MEKTASKKRNQLPIILTSLLAVLVTMVLLLLSAGWGNTDPRAEEYTEERAASVLTAETQQKSLEERAKKDTIRYSMEGNPVFETGSSSGGLMIENPSTNPNAIRVRIARKDTGEEIYDSGKLEPNTTINKDRLSVELDKGEYAAQAQVTLYDEEGRETESGITVELKITVQN